MITQLKEVKKEEIKKPSVVIPPLDSEKKEKSNCYQDYPHIKTLGRFSKFIIISCSLSIFFLAGTIFISNLNTALSFKIISVITLFLFVFDLLHSYKFFFK